MQNTQLDQFCQEHQDPIVAVVYNDQNTISQTLCLKCWPQNYNKKVVLLKDALDLSKNVKEEYQQFDFDNKLNIQKLYQLLQELEKLKIFMKQSINEQIKAIDNWIKSISDQELQAKTSLSNNNFDLYISLQNAQQQSQESQKQKEKYISFIQQQLILLKENEYFNQINELLRLIKEEKFDSPLNQNSQQLSQIDNMQHKLICQQHENEIVMVDLNQKPKIPQRLACVYCIQTYPTKYTAIKVAQKIWQKQETQKIQNLNKYSESIDQINLSLNTIKTTYNNIIQNVTSSLTQNKKEIKEKAEKDLKNLNFDWVSLKNDDVTELAEKISHNESQDSEKSKIYSDIIKINQEINHKINEAFIKMKQSQNSGQNLIKQLINQEYFNQKEDQTNGISQNNSSKEISCTTKKNQLQTIIQDYNDKVQQQSEYNQLIKNKKQEIKINKKTINEQNPVKKNQESKGSNLLELQQQSDEALKNQNNQQKIKKLHFALNSNSIDQEKTCRSFSFSTDSTYLIAACEKSIKLYKFNRGSLILLRILNGHPSMIVTCIFFKNQNRFISGCYDGSMLIWSNSKENEQEWKCEQILNDHKNYLGQIIYSKIDNMIISCSNDNTIKFWKQTQNWKLYQTLNGHNQYICSISLNDSENKLISGAYDDQILVSEPQGDDKRWVIIQVIKVEWGRRLCFITDNIFTFQPCKKDLMYIYQQKDSQSDFYKSKEIAVKSNGQSCLWLFPQQFSKKKSLLVNKNCHTINIIRWKRKNKFITDQTINFGTNEIYGSISDDGLWLITWDSSSKQIQIRGLK
ncbi:unnamed protein product [Paramecium sonneborni]|uniref:WD40-repeat-containing domain n=1 Tax=Paramecium sonneborni TaxID=65129 RepID=A0A8S1PPJ0_9CILI|nr:unnamed protein product [Paramecium sonneborni]